MDSKIRSIFTDSSTLKQSIAGDAKLISQISLAARKLQQTVKSGGTIFACGNGGSACDAMHLCEELVARFKRERAGFKAMHFGDSSTMSCWANDYDFASVYERQAQTFCGSADLLVGISTSGNSENILRAVKAAKAKGSFTIGLTGKDGGKLAGIADLSIVIPSKETERIQEAHITIIHAWCEMLES